MTDNPYLAGLDPTALTTCDREPIHRPGSIQPHGVLLVFDPLAQWVVAASGNTLEHLGLEVDAVVGARAREVVGDVAAARLADVALCASIENENPLVFAIPVRGQSRTFECAVRPSPIGLIAEFEPADPVSDMGLNEFYQAFRRAMNELQRITSVAELSDFAAAELRRLTGYDRVMVYRFDEEWTGTVVAERHAPGMEPFLGLRYPASDIPQQARRMYIANWMRMIVDIDYEPVPLIPDHAGLDMTRCALRSVAPVHLQYLRNMGVQATLTVSLLREGELIGMVACHHRVAKRISHHVRAACELFGRLLSLQLVALERNEAEARRVALERVQTALVGRLASAVDIADELTQGHDHLRALAGADGAIVRIEGEIRSVGRVMSDAAVQQIIAERTARGETGPLVSRALLVDHPTLEVVGTAGAVVIPLPGTQGDYLAWCRDELVTTTSWGGRPAKLEEGEVLTPRASFARWEEVVEGTCPAWYPEEIDAAERVAGMIPERLLARARERLAHLALHDALTGLPNRVLLLERLTQLLASEDRHRGFAALLFVDADRFKIVNDSHGHVIGDELLLKVADRLSQVVSADDTVARMGGDEFVVLCQGLAHPDEAVDVAGLIIEAFRRPFVVGGKEHLLTVSVGVAQADGSLNATEVLRNADAAMYQAKRSGRNRWALFDEELRRRAMDSLHLERGLRHAAERNELRLHYQPLVRSDGTVDSVEALVRWQHPELGLLLPERFLEIAETSDLVVTIGAWVLDAALAQLRRWDEQHEEWPRFAMAVNLSGRQLAVPGLDDLVLERLAWHGVDPHRLCLELTETAIIEHIDVATPMLEKLRGHGVGISVDDFGTGYSSLAYVRHLPVTQLKIDRSFVAGLDGAGRDSAVVASIVRLAHELSMEAVAEGVETAGQLAVVIDLGCDLIQGFHVARPVPEELFRLPDLLVMGSSAGPSAIRG